MSECFTDMTVPVSVAIPAFGDEDALTLTLEKILACSPLPSEILLHFDGGWTPDRDLSLNSPVPIRIYTSPVCLGPGGGRQRLIEEASCEYIASFDDDSWPLDKEYFAQAVAVMDAFPQAAVISPAIYLAEQPMLPQLPEISTARTFLGSASIHRKSIHQQLPGYVPVAEAYGVEESDLSLQAHSAGYQILSCPWMRAWHQRPLSDDLHSVHPWVKNELLLTYLRYPRIAQPLGLSRSLRHIVRNWRRFPPTSLFRSLFEAIPRCAEFSKYKHRYGLAHIWRHLRSKSQNWQIRAATQTPAMALRIAVSEFPAGPKIAYVQYANHGAYPPLEHSSRLLAQSGAEVLFLGTTGNGTELLEFPKFPRIKELRMTCSPPGLRQKLHYLRFTLWIVWRAWRHKAQWLYVSDPLACFPGLVASWLLRIKTVYHEHDCLPDLGPRRSLSDKLTGTSHRLMCQNANLVVAPNQKRLDCMPVANRRPGNAVCVWNCPRIDEVGPPKSHPKHRISGLKILFHGSIGPERFPLHLIQALAACPDDISIRLVGYEPQGSSGFTAQLIAEAQRVGVAHRFEYRGSMPHRSELLSTARDCDVGLCLLTFRPNDINSIHMAGASNKAFDYLSQGLAVVVPDDDEWKRIFISAGCGVPGELSDVISLTNCFKWLAEHPDEVSIMGERGRQKILAEWNYETTFAPVFRLITQ